MGSEVTSIFITGCFWYWTVCKITVTISPLREESRWHQRLANLAFAVLVLIQFAGLFMNPDVGIWMVSILSAVTIVLILVFSKFDREGFWSKSRNQIVGSMALLGSGALSPLLFKETSLVALAYAVILAQEFHRAQIKQFVAIHKDLDSMRVKVTRLEASLQAGRVEESARDSLGKRAEIYLKQNPEIEKVQFP